MDGPTIQQLCASLSALGRKYEKDGKFHIEGSNCGSLLVYKSQDSIAPIGHTSLVYILYYGNGIMRV